ncbi:aminodeoxychorismate lyase [Chitinolyticbacter meiyuanensis]|uniref:aminodeoxychorismate lyase n=1 Tax=Chitinolyticbacter meiyuanensis TaxID=682798 RepID=UPI0011E5A708|nr:aminodeoxychorismate lyase [Chitinolyticbacter meiyuanensis]
MTRLVDGVPAESLPLTDRAVQFGDGVFRTVRCDGGGVRFWRRQYDKLAADGAALGIVVPPREVFEADIRLLALGDAALKLIVTRGESVRGYAVPADCHPHRIVQASALPPPLPVEGVRVRWCETRAGWQPALAGIKHLNRLENVLARREWSDPTIFEGLLLDRDGHVLEGVLSNVLALSGKVLFTPRLDGAGVAGVMRAVLCEAAARCGLQVRHAALTPAALLAADRLYLCNSLIGLTPVRELAGQHWGAHALDATLQAQLQSMIEEETWRYER